jgi:hypothetical protein
VLPSLIPCACITLSFLQTYITNDKWGSFLSEIEVVILDMIYEMKLGTIRMVII